VAHPIPDAVSTLDFPAETVTRGDDLRDIEGIHVVRVTKPNHGPLSRLTSIGAPAGLPQPVSIGRW